MPSKDYFVETRFKVDRFLARVKEDFPSERVAWIDDLSMVDGVTRLLHASHYATEVCLSRPEILVDLASSGQFQEKLSRSLLMTSLTQDLVQAEDEKTLMRLLRIFRHKQMLRILWQDINKLSSITQTMNDLSVLAECCIDGALRWLSDCLKQQLGTPYASGVEQEMVVLGMGKLGGKELNFSSDVDLIFCYPHRGNTQGGSREVDNQWFFNRLGQSLIRVLDSITVDGFVYRMDLRLRPYGSSSELAWSFSAMEQYYQDQGRDWERYAFLKARPVAGDKSQGLKLLKLLKPFMYRRYLDFSAIEALREMKALIHREVLQKGIQKDIKLGAGGIREIEFIVQSFQLIYGGQKPQLQSTSLLAVLDNLIPHKFLSKKEANQLQQAYLFLRRFEHLIQAWDDKQTHAIPTDPVLQSVLADEMGYTSWTKLSEGLEGYRNNVEALFSSLMSEPDIESDVVGEWQLLWDKMLDERESIDLLSENNFQQAPQVYQQLMFLRNGRALKNASRRGLSRVNRFMPLLINTCESQASPDQALLRVLPIVSKVLRRTSYLVLLFERPEALFHLVKLCHESLWIAGEIAKYPSLMDEFLSPGDLYNPPPPGSLNYELSQQLSHIAQGDVESRLEALCYFKMAHSMKSVVAQTNSYMQLMSVSDYLTWVAEALLKEVTQLAWFLMEDRYGLPAGYKQSSSVPFIVLGYGKMGGLEMGPNSDLDLVFIHDTDVQECTNGVHSIDNQTFFARFGQKVIHLLSTQTAFGKLYEVDVRLRPSGSSGLLVSSFHAFHKYQNEAAWIWESQALVKARVVAGDHAGLMGKFNLLRREILQRDREQVALKSEIKSMRGKMSVLDCSSSQFFDIKYGRGGMIDLEFIVQYLVLRWAGEHESLLQWTDNIRLLETLSDLKVVSDDEAEQLKQAYLLLRETHHQRARQSQDNCVERSAFLKEREAVIKSWNHLLDDKLVL